MYEVVCDGNKCRRVKVTREAKKSSLEERIERRMHSEQTRRKSKTRKSRKIKSPKRKSPKRKSPKRKSPKRKSKRKSKSRKTEDILVYYPRDLVEFKNLVDHIVEEFFKKLKKQKINVKNVGVMNSFDNAMFTIPAGTYAEVKKCWEDTLTKHGIKKTWPIAKSLRQLEKMKERLGLDVSRESQVDDVKRMMLKRKSPKRKSPKRKSPKRKSPKRKSRKKRHKYDEAWAKRMVTHVGPGENNYTGAKRVPSRKILDERKKRIDAIYKIFYEILDTDIVCARELFGDALRSPDDWRDPPQYMDREFLKDTLKTLKREKKAFCT